MRNRLTTLAALLLLQSPLCARADVAQWFRDRPPSPYRLDPLLDTALLGIGLPAYLGLFYLENQLAPPSCGQPSNPCDRSQIPAFDRGAITYHPSLKLPADLVFEYGPMCSPPACSSTTAHSICAAT